jgi:hypothetical protein
VNDAASTNAETMKPVHEPMTRAKRKCGGYQTKSPGSAKAGRPENSNADHFVIGARKMGR